MELGEESSSLGFFFIFCVFLGSFSFFSLYRN